MKYLKFITVAVAFILMLGGNAQAVLIIDDFSDTQSLTASVPGITWDFAPGSMVGGERDLRLQLISGDFGSLKANPGSTGYLAFGLAPASIGTGRVIWDGTDGSSGLNFTGLGNLDLTETATQAGIEMKVISDDLPVIGGLQLDIYTNSGNWSTFLYNIPGGIPPAPSITVLAPWASFAIAGGLGADFSDVGMIRLSLGAAGVEALDFEVDYVKTYAPPSGVPEPATMLLFGSGLVGVYFLRKRIS